MSDQDGAKLNRRSADTEPKNYQKCKSYCPSEFALVMTDEQTDTQIHKRSTETLSLEPEHLSKIPILLLYFKKKKFFYVT